MVIESQTSPAVHSPPPGPATDPLHGLHPGRIVYYWETVMNRGLAVNPALVVEVRRDGEGHRTGSVRLAVFYVDGADGPKPEAWFSEKPAAGKWTWPMQADGTPNVG